MASILGIFESQFFLNESGVLFSPVLHLLALRRRDFVKIRDIDENFIGFDSSFPNSDYPTVYDYNRIEDAVPSKSRRCKLVFYGWAAVFISYQEFIEGWKKQYRIAVDTV